MLSELRTLIAIAKEGTYAAAGKKVGLTQAAVSAQMQRLQMELGFSIFDRKGRSACLNKTGCQIVIQAQEVIRLYESLGASNAGYSGSIHLRIGAIGTVQRSILPSILVNFHKQCPGCHTRTVAGTSMELIDLIDAGELDVAIVIQPSSPPQRELQWTTLLREPFRLIKPRGIPGDDWGELLSKQPFIRYNRTSFGGRQVDRFLRSIPILTHEVCELDELDSIIMLVASRVGVALVPETKLYRRWPKAIKALDLKQHTFYREVGLVHREFHFLNEPARILAQIISRSGHTLSA